MCKAHAGGNCTKCAGRRAAGQTVVACTISICGGVRDREPKNMKRTLSIPLPGSLFTAKGEFGTRLHQIMTQGHTAYKRPHLPRNNILLAIAIVQTWNRQKQSKDNGARRSHSVALLTAFLKRDARLQQTDAEFTSAPCAVEAC